MWWVSVFRSRSLALSHPHFLTCLLCVYRERSTSLSSYIRITKLAHIFRRWRSKRWWTSLHKNEPSCARGIAEDISNAAASHATRAISLSGPNPSCPPHPANLFPAPSPSPSATIRTDSPVCYRLRPSLVPHRRPCLALETTTVAALVIRPTRFY